MKREVGPEVVGGEKEGEEGANVLLAGQFALRIDRLLDRGRENCVRKSRLSTGNRSASRNFEPGPASLLDSVQP